MFTPQRKAPWTPAASAPRTESRATASRFVNSAATSLKGKAVAFIDGPSPPPLPLGSLASESARRGSVGSDAGRFDDWTRFKEAGLLDESAMERKDYEALLEKASRIEKELFDYQYNMGLLLIEKNDVVSKNEELGQVVAESREILKREQAAHLIAISEAEKREDNLKKALDIEKKCVADLERALRDMREEHAKIKDTSKTTVADVNARMEELEEKRMELEAKSQSVNAKLAEVDRKTSELDRKLRDLEAHENILKVEHLTLTQEREAYESYFRKQKEDLVEWERKLQEAEQRLCDSRRNLKEREEKLHETEKFSEEKESKLAELQQKIELAEVTLKKMEDDISNQSMELNSKEKKFEATRCNLEMREKQLKEKEEKLNTLEKVELQKRLSEQKTILDAKMHEFESEMRQKRATMEEELESKKQAIDQRETEINHLVAKLAKREQALEKKLERVKEKEKDVDEKVKGLKEQEKGLKAEEKRLQAEKEQLNADKEHVENSKQEIEALKTDLENQEHLISEERKRLENVEVERSEYLRLQLNLKLEMENVRRQNEVIDKEAEDLRLLREKFEKDWEALDEKRTAVETELKKLSEEKAYIEKFRKSEEDRLQKKKTEVEEYIRLETESIKLKEESFEANMNNEKLMLSQKAENKHNLLVQDYEQQRENLEKDFQKRQKEWEMLVQEKERVFEDMTSREMRNINHLKEVAKKRKEEMEIERHCMEKERQEIELNKKQLEETSIDIAKDIDALDNLSKKLKNQREQLMQERAHFCAFIDKIKSCKICGDSAQEFLHKDLQLPTLEGLLDLPRHSHLDQKDSKDEPSPFGELSRKTDYSESRGRKSILQKCASLIFHLSPNKGKPTDDQAVEDTSHCAARQQETENEGADTSLLRSDEVNVGTIASADKIENALSVDDSNIDTETQDIQESEVSRMKSSRRKPGKKRGTIRRTTTIKAVVEDAKAFLGEISEGKIAEEFKKSTLEMANGQEKTISADTVGPTAARKRTRSQASKMAESELDVDVSEGKADGVTTDGRRKRPQTVASSLTTPGQRRYNLRRHTAAGAAAEGQQSSDGKTINDNDLAHQAKEQPANNNLHNAPTQSLDITVDSNVKVNMVQVSTTRSIEYSSDRIVRDDNTAKAVDSYANATKSVEETVLSREAKSAEDTSLTEETSENVNQDYRSNLNEIREEEDVNEGDNDDNDDDDTDDDDDDHPEQVSIGKSLWKFFTT